MTHSTERKIWVAYKQDEGFLTRTNNTTLDFSKARIYTGRGHLSNSVSKKAIEDGTYIPVPITLEIDPEVLVILRLGGNPYEG